MKFRLVLTVDAQGSDASNPDDVFSTVGRKFAGVLSGGPTLEGEVVRASIDDKSQATLYIEGELK